MECSQCKKQLSKGSDEDVSFEGHYIYNDLIYCMNCWELANLATPESSIKLKSKDSEET